MIILFPDSDELLWRIFGRVALVGIVFALSHCLGGRGQILDESRDHRDEDVAQRLVIHHLQIPARNICHSFSIPHWKREAISNDLPKSQVTIIKATKTTCMT